MGVWRRHIYASSKQFDGMQAFYLNALLRSLVFSLVGIFTPVFIYTSMLPVLGTSSRAVASVAMFYVVVRSVTLLIDIPSARLIEKLGFRRSVVISVLILIGYLGVMAEAEQHWQWLILAAPLLGTSVPFYWIARGSVIAIDSKTKGLGKQLGFLAVLERVAGILGPVAAGFIVVNWGFSMMYWVAFVILVGSVVPLFAMPHHIHRNGVSLKGYLGWLTDRRFFHQAVGTVARSMDDYGVGMVWPLLIVLMGVEYGVLGGVWSFLTFLSLLVRYGGGLVFDKLYKKGGLEDEALFGIAAIGTAVAWVLRLFVTSISGVLWVDGGSTVFSTTYRNISDDYSFLGGKRMHEIAYFTYLQMTYSIGVIMFCLVWMVGAYYGVWRELLFLLTSFWVLLSIVRARESNLA